MLTNSEKVCVCIRRVSSCVTMSVNGVVFYLNAYSMSLEVYGVQVNKVLFPVSVDIHTCCCTSLSCFVFLTPGLDTRSVYCIYFFFILSNWILSLIWMRRGMCACDQSFILCVAPCAAWLVCVCVCSDVMTTCCLTHFLKTCGVHVFSSQDHHIEDWRSRLRSTGDWRRSFRTEAKAPDTNSNSSNTSPDHTRDLG